MACNCAHFVCAFMHHRGMRGGSYLDRYLDRNDPNPRAVAWSWCRFGFQLHDFVLFQSNYWCLFLYAPAASGFVLILFLESKRAPFDHSETEAEVVAGYSTEYNGSMLLMFFLAEYLHLVISAIHFIIFFIGG